MRRPDHQLSESQEAWTELLKEARPIGVVSVAMAVRHKVPVRSLRRRAAKQRWTKLQPGVWLYPGFELTHRRRCHAVQQRASKRAVIARQSAALLHGLRQEEPEHVQVVKVRNESVRSLEEADVRETRTLLKTDVVETDDDLWLTEPARTVGDLAGVRKPEDVLYAAITGRQQDLLTQAGLGKVRARLWPATGTATLGWVIDEMNQLDSGLEWAVRRGLDEAGLPAPHPEPYKLPCPDGRTIHLDIAWPPWRVGLEVMGLSAHGLQTSRTDQIRHNQATAGEWTILYVGWERWRRERDKVLDELRTVLAARGAPV